jgi:hypothetical protein
MATYIVRTIETLRLVGIFVAKNPTDLYRLVDLEQNPGSCEYLNLQDGEGLFVDARFTGSMHDNGPGERAVLSVGIEPVDDPDRPCFTRRLETRLCRGRSWTAFTAEHFAGAFGIPMAKFVEACRIEDAVQ